MIGIRWSRGFFRLWLVFSGIWLLAMTAAWWLPVFSPRAYFYPRYYAVPLATGIPTEVPENELAGFHTLKVDGRVKQVEFGPPPGHPDISTNWLFVKPTTTDEQIGDTIDAIAAILIKEEAEQIASLKAGNLRTAAAWTLIPPTVLLALGAALTWVLRGFARDSSRRQPS